MKKVFLTLLVVAFATVVFGSAKEIKPTALPKCVSEWVTKNLPGYTIGKAYEVQTKTEQGVVTTYLARLDKDKVTYQWVQTDPNCKEVKKLTQKDVDQILGVKPMVQPK
jgi:hypothetical protein